MSSKCSEIDIEALKQQIRQEVAVYQETAPMKRFRPIPVGVDKRLKYANSLINSAAALTQPRTSLPPRFDRFPLSLNRKLPKIVLKVYHFLFKEQRAINSSLIQTAREFVSLNRRSARDMVELRTQLEQIQIRLVELEKQSSSVIIPPSE